jgi:hypothetical protein
VQLVYRYGEAYFNPDGIENEGLPMDPDEETPAPKPSAPFAVRV